jgi:steroid 5-alpha reductase family enzyme
MVALLQPDGRIDAFLLVGTAIWTFGYGFEVIADLQKAAFKKRPENKGQFIRLGLWTHSRHPNYFGEILLWVGIAVISVPTLSGSQFLALASPLFVFLLLNYVSGVPMLEKRADKKWGHLEAYQIYKRRTPVLIPRLRPKD